jgi:ElaB/YqjD/DUF883 family membrane-anchored ribosome-binding protein
MTSETPETGTEIVEAGAAATETPENPTARISSFVSEHPRAAAGAAIAAGAVIGMMLPRLRIGIIAGSAISRTARQAAKAIGTAGAAKAILSGITTATDNVKAGANRLVDHVPDADTVKASAKRALERASETAQKASEKVAGTARRTIKTGED